MGSRSHRPHRQAAVGRKGRLQVDLRTVEEAATAVRVRSEVRKAILKGREALTC